MVVATMVMAVVMATVAPQAAAQVPPPNPPPWGNHGGVVISDNGAWIFSHAGLDSQFPYPKQIFDQWNAVRSSAEAEITALATPLIRQELAKERVSLRTLSTSIANGPTELSFTGAGNGNIVVNAKLPTVTVTLTGEKDPFDIWMQITAGPADASLNYNLLSGVVSGVTIHSLPTSVRIDVDSDNWFVQAFNFLSGGAITNIADDIVKDMVEEAVADTTAEYTTLLASFSVQTVGLDDVLPQDLTVQGVDVDQLIRDAIAGNLTGQLVSIRISNGGPAWTAVAEAYRVPGGVDALTVTIAGRYALRVEHYNLQPPPSPPSPRTRPGAVCQPETGQFCPVEP